MPKYSDLFSDEAMDDYLSRVSPSYTQSGGPRRFLIQRELFEVWVFLIFILRYVIAIILRACHFAALGILCLIGNTCFLLLNSTLPMSIDCEGDWRYGSAHRELPWTERQQSDRSTHRRCQRYDIRGTERPHFNYDNHAIQSYLTGSYFSRFYQWIHELLISSQPRLPPC